MSRLPQWRIEGWHPHGPGRCRCPECGQAVDTNALARATHKRYCQGRAAPLNPPDVRTLDDGATVVDLGAKWFRVETDGTVIVKEAVNRPGDEFATVVRRPATRRERVFVRGEIAKAKRGSA